MLRTQTLARKRKKVINEIFATEKTYQDHLRAVTSVSKMVALLHTVFPRIIAGGDYFFFRTERGRLFKGRRLFEGGDYFKYFSQEIVP